MSIDAASMLLARGGSKPIVGQFAPGILYAKMVELLDETMVEYTTANDLSGSKPSGWFEQPFRP